MAAHGLGDSTQTKQRINDKMLTIWSSCQTWEGVPFPVNYSVDSVGVPLTETGPKCTLAVKLPDSPWGACAILLIWFWGDDTGAYQAQWRESLWLAETIPGSMAGKPLIGWDFAMGQEGGVQLSRSNYPNDTQLEYGDSVNGTAFPRSSEGNQLT